MDQWLRLAESRGDKVFYFTGNSLSTGQPEQGSRGAPGGGKDALLVLLQPVTGESDGHGPGLGHEQPQQLPLLWGEVCKAVQPEVHTLPPAAGTQLVRRPGEPVPGVQGGLGGEGLVLPENEPQVPELVPLGAGRLLPRPDQQLGQDPAAFQLVRRSQQGGKKGGPPGGPAVDLQLGGHPLHRPVHQQQPSAGLQLLLPQAPGPLKNPVGQAAEGQHLRPEVNLGTAGGAQGPLGLVGHLLRHQQHLGPLPARLTQPVQYGGGLARPRPA